jgi:glycosyltransferase involved in cell wall biosynthesis
VSSGDAVGPFMRAHHRVAGWAFEIYERLLCARSAGFIGWTPYLCGRAMTFGSPRAVTAAGWALGGDASAVNVPEARERTRAKFGIPPDDIVVGIVGALEWNAKKQYCYGWDLVECARRVKRQDLKFVIIGGGSGLDRLRAMAGDRLGKQIFLPGPVPLEEVVPSMCAFDIASLPQSMDGVGMFRYTTKIAEYFSARLPVITNQVPMAYDLGAEWMWRLPGNAPWDVVFLDALGRFLEGLQRSEIVATKAKIPTDLAGFHMDEQIRRITLFINDLTASPRLQTNS